MSRWYKRDAAAFIQGTMGLSLEEKGAYSLCLDLIYSNGGPIADDPRWLAGVCGVSLRKWTAIRGSLIDRGKLTAQDGLLMNARAEREIADLAVSHGGAAENGAKGGRKRAENAAKAQRNPTKPERKDAEKGVTSSENNDLAQADKNRGDKRRTEEKEETPALRAVAVHPQTELLPDPVPGKGLIPPWIPADAWAGYVEMRRKIRAPLSPRAIKLAISELSKLRSQGEDIGAVLDQSTLRSYRGVFPVKQDQNINGGRHGGPHQKSAVKSFAAGLSRSIQGDDSRSGLFDGGEKVIDAPSTGDPKRDRDAAA